MEITQLQKVAWRPYHDIYYERHRHTISGNIQIAQQVYSPQLKNQRDILVYLPPTYDHSQQRYPVLYMHDGYNLFDEATSYTGEWHVDETMEALSAEENLEAIVVGVPSMGQERLAEYSPFVDKAYGGGKGEAYLNFMVHTLKPLIDQSFRTLPNKANTGIMGSSMGGLISLYAFFQYPSVYGFAGVMSPSVWFANRAILSYLEETTYQEGKIYLDAGTREMGGHWPDQTILRSRSRRYYGRVRRIKRILVKKGYRPTRNLLHVEDVGGGHNESAWAFRLPTAIRYFLGATHKKAA